MVQVEPENVLSFLGVVIAAWLSHASARVAARAKVQTVTQEKEDGKIQAAIDRVLDVMEEGFAARDRTIGRLDSRRWSVRMMRGVVMCWTGVRRTRTGVGVRRRPWRCGLICRISVRSRVLIPGLGRVLLW